MALLTIAALGAAALGAAGHVSAKKTNEKAEQVAYDAQELYESAENSLKIAKNKAEKSLEILGKSKKNVFDTSFKQFVDNFEKVKHISFEEYPFIDKLDLDTISSKEVVEMVEMNSLYDSALSSGAAGAASGAFVALAASGSLPLLAGELAFAGSLVTAGEIGLAASTVGTTLTAGLAMTPLAAIAAPVVLFTGISSSMKADENLEKAETMYSQAEAAASKMRTQEMICDAIEEKSDMFNDLLLNLNNYFSESTNLLAGVISKKQGIFRKNKPLKSSDFTEDELKLLAITGALAKAIKQVIVTNALNESGEVSSEANLLTNNSEQIIEDAKEKIEDIRRLDLKAKPVKGRVINENRKNNSAKSSKKPLILDAFRNILSPLVGFLGIVIAVIILEPAGVVDDIFVWIAFSSFALVGINVNTSFKIFRGLRNIYSFTLFLEFAFLLYYTASYLIAIEHFWLWVIGAIVLSLIIAGVFTPNDESGSLKKLLSRLSYLIFFFAIAIVIYKALNIWIGWTSKTSMIITQVLYVPMAFVSVFMQDYGMGTD